MTRTEMMKELVALQNMIEHTDILTITGFMSDQDVANHLARYQDLTGAKMAFIETTGNVAERNIQ